MHTLMLSFYSEYSQHAAQSAVSCILICREDSNIKITKKLDNPSKEEQLNTVNYSTERHLSGMDIKSSKDYIQLYKTSKLCENLTFLLYTCMIGYGTPNIIRILFSQQLHATPSKIFFMNTGDDRCKNFCNVFKKISKSVRFGVICLTIFPNKKMLSRVVKAADLKQQKLTLPDNVRNSQS